MRLFGTRGACLRLAVLVLVGIVSIGGLLAASAAEAARPPGYAPRFFVFGRVDNRKAYDLSELKKLPVHEVTTSFIGPGGTQNHKFRGALLLDIAKAASPRFNASQKNDKLNWSARVHASDGYSSIVAWGEFDTDFENKQVLIAFMDNGVALEEEGMARLVVPGDIRGGRYVSNVDAIVFEPPHAAENWGSFPTSVLSGMLEN